MLNPENLVTTYRLIPKTHKAKNRLREAGTDVWIVEKVEPIVVCLKGKTGALIRPSNTEDPKFRRWVCSRNDPDFEMEAMFN